MIGAALVGSVGRPVDPVPLIQMRQRRMSTDGRTAQFFASIDEWSEIRGPFDLEDGHQTKLEVSSQGWHIRKKKLADEEGQSPVFSEFR